MLVFNNNNHSSRDFTLPKTRANTRKAKQLLFSENFKLPKYFQTLWNFKSTSNWKLPLGDFFAFFMYKFCNFSLNFDSFLYKNCLFWVFFILESILNFQAFNFSVQLCFIIGFYWHFDWIFIRKIHFFKIPFSA